MNRVENPEKNTEQLAVLNFNWFLTKEPKQFNGERIAFSINDSRTTEYPHAKEQLDPSS